MTSAALTAMAALAWFGLLFGARATGLEAARANGTSMEPALHHGDALLLGDVDASSVQTGDVVWALHGGRPIMHRVIDAYNDARGLRMVVTKGDNVAEADRPVPASEVQGRLVAKVPLLGAAARALGLDDGFALLSLLLQGFAASSLFFGLVYLQDVRRRPDAASRTSSPQGLIEP